MKKNRKLRVYISGKITGLKGAVYQRNFRLAAMELFDKGYSVINPAATQGTLPEDMTYEEYMQMSMLELSFCDAIYMLKNWRDSNGAKKEHKYAVEHGYTVLYQE